MHEAEVMMRPKKKRPHCKDQRNNDGSEKRVGYCWSIETGGRRKSSDFMTSELLAYDLRKET